MINDNLIPSPAAALSQASVTERPVALSPDGGRSATMTDNIPPFSRDCSFDPQAIQVMGSAYERACRSLQDIGQPDLVKEIIARRIIEVAQAGERDIDRLCERALIALGFHERT
jgi:hypothetical protein